jgi:hypothetical protein
MTIRNLLEQHEQHNMNMWLDVVNKKPNATDKTNKTWCDLDYQAKIILSRRSLNP